ncbi:hypothetical protein CPB86DRAFT_777921 [Serendipita vermifera]|nr:hypothetical protein CPB86DRAFT_777921 [Serendipita vermifera]
MRLFPSDAFTNGSRTNPGLWRFKRTLRPRDWEAFGRYAPLVRHVSFREGKDILPSAIIALDIQRPSRYRGAPFIPNLNTLKWTTATSNTLTLCSVFASPSLRKLVVHVVGNDAPAAERSDATGGLLCTLVDLSPGLNVLDLRIDQLWAVGDVVNPLNALLQLQTLTLDVGSIGPFILRGICSHASLTTLTIDLCGIDERFLDHLVTHRPKPGEFPALRELSISADMQIVNTTLSLILRASLHRLSISTYSLIPRDGLHTCLNLLNETCPDLQELRVTTSFGVGDAAATFAAAATRGYYHQLTLQDLLPVMRLKQLNVLSLQLGYPVALDDMDVAMVLGALPRLREVVLSHSLEWVPTLWIPKVTNQSLEWISRHAKHITTLGLAVDGRTIPFGASSVPDREASPIQSDPRQQSSGPLQSPTPPLTPEPSFTSGSDAFSPSTTREPSPILGESRLEFLCIGPSSVAARGETQIAQYLLQLFPALRGVQTSDLHVSFCPSTLNRSAAFWENVSKMIALQAGRHGRGDQLRAQTLNEATEVEHTFDDIEMEDDAGNLAISQDVDLANEYEWHLVGDVE